MHLMKHLRKYFAYPVQDMNRSMICVMLVMPFLKNSAVRVLTGVSPFE
ncbi:hypothetical protein T4A_12824 [Trichinella pseudospiralis]|uniref:Uncharacterized protein n=1 Tax=Trichinella pseudospiralis TaxID=6337 RepID=A0A0V1DP10_TRIPS|nr:hypothetical protein T4A_12824 [Trichinella pseudospiralis]